MHTFHFKDDSRTPGLADLIKRQQDHGGRLISYKRAWAAVVIVTSQDRIEWVPPGENRHLAEWRHSLFTCVAGIWSFPSIIVVPMVLFANFRGRIDVTEFFSRSSTDPFRKSVPVPGTAKKEEKYAQWAMLGFLSLALVVALVLVFK